MIERIRINVVEDAAEHEGYTVALKNGLKIAAYRLNNKHVKAVKARFEKELRENWRSLLRDWRLVDEYRHHEEDFYVLVVNLKTDPLFLVLVKRYLRCTLEDFRRLDPQNFWHCDLILCRDESLHWESSRIEVLKQAIAHNEDLPIARLVYCGKEEKE